MSGTADQHSKRASHRPYISTQIKDVRGEKECDNRVEHPDRVVTPNVSGDTHPGHLPDPGADLLYTRHQRIGENHCPEHRESELRSYLRVSRDAAGVVVGSTGNNSRSELRN